MHPKIAVLTDEYTEYRKVLVDTIAAENTRQGFATLCVSGRELNPRRENQQDFSLGNEIYPVLQHHDIKGIISLSGAIGNNVSVEHLGDFLRQFSLPKTSLGLTIPGLSGVEVDDHAGMTHLMHHLVTETKARRFAFVRGFESDPYSQQRERIFRRTLIDFNIPIDESLIINGNYDSFESYRAVSDMLIEHTDSVDAIVAANDCMALSAARAAAARGYDVPNDILITGYDDTKEATKVSPALTTVRQPLTEMARLSVELLLEQINFRSIANPQTNYPIRTVQVTPELVVRGSTISMIRSNRTDAFNDRSVVHRQISQSMAGLQPPDDIDFDQIIDGFYAALFENTNALAKVLNKELIDRIQTGQQQWWLNLCYQFEKTTLQFVTQPPEDNAHSSVLAALTSVKERCWTITMEHEFQTQRLERAHTDMQLQISSCTTLDDILATTKDWLKIIKPRRFFLIRYKTPAPTPPETAILIHAYKADEMRASDEQEFHTHDLLPESLRKELQQGLLVLNPIFAGELHFGYLLLDPTSLESGNMTAAALSIGNAMRNRHMISQLKTQTDSLQCANAELIQLARFDALTGLPNRLYFRLQLEKSFTQCMKSKLDLSVLFIDLDGFKFVNDSLGHKAGDDLLISIADELRTIVSNSTSQTGIVARLGGDEFTVILQNRENAHTIATLGQDILIRVAEPRTFEGRPVAISASIGYSNLSLGAKDAESLLHQADSAMYQAKRSGKNKLTAYDAKYDTATDPRPRIESSIRRALSDGSLVVHYQPRVDSVTGDIRAAEALMRWIETTEEGPRVIAHPDEFIPIAEASGLIKELDLLALNQSCQQIRQWQLQGLKIPVSVNISMIHLQQNDFIDRVLQVINSHNVSPEMLELEITEGAVMTDVQSSIRKLQKIQEAGIRVAIDDFGTGYSSLAYLKKLPINNLKIDRAFIKDYIDQADNDPTDAAIFRTIVTLGKTLKLGLIAEGIETSNQLTFIQSLGVEEAQGYYFYKPMPADELSDILLNNTDTMYAA